jgi:hypothetical protein
VLHKFLQRGRTVKNGWRMGDEEPSLLWVANDLNYPAVLVRLSRVTPDVLRDLLGMAHKFVTARRRR